MINNMLNIFLALQILKIIILNYDIRLEEKYIEHTRYYLSNSYFIYYDIIDKNYHIQNEKTQENNVFRFEQGRGEHETLAYGEYVVSNGILYHLDVPQLKILSYNLETKEIRENILSNFYDLIYLGIQGNVGLFSQTSTYIAKLDKESLQDIEITEHIAPLYQLREYNMFLTFNRKVLESNGSLFLPNLYYPIIIDYKNDCNVIKIDNDFDISDIKISMQEHLSPPDFNKFRNVNSLIKDGKIYLVYFGEYNNKLYKKNELYIYDIESKKLNVKELKYNIESFVTNDENKILIISTDKKLFEYNDKKK